MEEKIHHMVLSSSTARPSLFLYYYLLYTPQSSLFPPSFAKYAVSSISRQYSTKKVVAKQSPKVVSNKNIPSIPPPPPTSISNSKTKDPAPKQTKVSPPSPSPPPISSSASPPTQKTTPKISNKSSPSKLDDTATPKNVSTPSTSSPSSVPSSSTNKKTAKATKVKEPKQSLPTEPSDQEPNSPSYSKESSSVDEIISESPSTNPPSPATQDSNNGEKKISIEEMYQKKTPVEHILLRPDSYIGSILHTHQEQWVYVSKENRMIYKECKYPTIILFSFSFNISLVSLFF